MWSDPNDMPVVLLCLAQNIIWYWVHYSFLQWTKMTCNSVFIACIMEVILPVWGRFIQCCDTVGICMNTVAGIKNVKHSLYPRGADDFFFLIKTIYLSQHINRTRLCLEYRYFPHVAAVKPMCFSEPIAKVGGGLCGSQSMEVQSYCFPLFLPVLLKNIIGTSW